MDLDKLQTVANVEVAGKRLLVRADLNVPTKDGEVSDTTRLQRLLLGLRDLSARGARIVVISHFGRPKGAPNPEMSLRPVATKLGDLLGVPVQFVPDCVGAEAEAAVAALKPGEIAVLENLRFHPGEEKNDAEFAAKLARCGDIFVNDAFSAAHRAHASTEGLAHHLPSCAGRLMQAELEALQAALGQPKRPVVAVVGGAKVSTKLDLLGNLVEKVDHLVIGGGMANTFLAAQGLNVGKSLCEHDMADTARTIMSKAGAAGCEILLPADVVVAREFAANAPHETVPAHACPTDAMILDAGPQSVARITAAIDAAKTLIWNGPLGAFEIEPFDTATNAAAAHAAARSKAGELISVAGGGDTVAALNKAGAAQDFTYISTAGGAFLEWMEGKALPGVAALEC